MDLVNESADSTPQIAPYWNENKFKLFSKSPSLALSAKFCQTSQCHKFPLNVLANIAMAKEHLKTV